MTIPLFEIKLSKAPIVILKGGDRQLTFYKVKKFGSKYFAIKDPVAGGMVFELDDRYEYRYRRSSLYIYNFSNFKPISLTGLAEIDKKLRKDGKSQLENINTLLSQLTDEQIDGLGDKIKDPSELFSPETKRFLEDYSTDDENAKTELIISLHHLKKKPIPKYSGPLIGLGRNTGNFAFIQIGHKKLDIVPMQIKDNRAYTEYGVFNFTIDNLYLVKKQIVAFFVLNDTEDSISQPVPKPVVKQMNKMVRRKQWSFLETFNKANKVTKIKEQKFGYSVKIEKVERPDDTEIKEKINEQLKPKPEPKKNKKDNEDIIYQKIQDDNYEQLPKYEEPLELNVVPDTDIEIESNDNDNNEPIIETNELDLELAEATGPPQNA